VELSYNEIQPAGTPLGFLWLKTAEVKFPWRELKVYWDSFTSTKPGQSQASVLLYAKSDSEQAIKHCDIHQ
jgi:hypothetical protein